MYKFLRYCRVALSLLFLAAFTLIFVDIYSNIATKLFVLLRWQIVPSILGIATGSLAILTVLLLITLFFGRVYCSTLCPLGTFQDIVRRIANLFKTKKQRRFDYAKPHNYWRYGILTMAIVLFIAGSTTLILWLDPYSNYGRIAENLFKPLVVWGNNSLAHIRPAIPVFTMDEVTGAGILVAAVIFLLVIGFSAFRGRLWCNTMCPVGSLLGLVSRYAIFRLGIDKDACTSCTLCEKQCKSQCIDSKTHFIDSSRCVQCMNCMQLCKSGAISHHYLYTKNTRKPAQSMPNDSSRRRVFLGSLGALGLAAVYRVAGKPLRIATPRNDKAIAPPGARSISELKHHCTACHACIANCPTKTLRPTVGEYGLDGVMLPVMDYDISFCNYECNVCTQVCPNGALIPLQIEEKMVTQVGKAHFFRGRCVVFTDETDCGACNEHCPTKAIRMVPYKEELRIPEVDVSLCVGCGGCEYICPTRPRAMIVYGNPVHETVEMPEKQVQEQKEVDDFGF